MAGGAPYQVDMWGILDPPDETAPTASGRRRRTSTESTFFREKRSWSRRIKDPILSGYATAAFPKLAQLPSDVLLIDAFAGPGRFDDGTAGSPLILLELAERWLPGRYRAYLLNKQPGQHRKLQAALGNNGERATCILVRPQDPDPLGGIAAALTDETVILYCDPFGLSGLEFARLLPFLQRSNRYSTEILLTLCRPVIARLAAWHGAMGPQILTRVLGGDYWRPLLARRDLSVEERIDAVVAEYRGRLARHLPYTGSCPVRSGPGQRAKYEFIFASRHPDALLLMNDLMGKACAACQDNHVTAVPLYPGTEWDDSRPGPDLDALILGTVRSVPGISREGLWLRIVRAHFLRFLKKEFTRSVKRLADEHQLEFTSTTGRLNDRAQLVLPAHVRAEERIGQARA